MKQLIATMQATEWTLEEALSLIRAIQPLVCQFNYHVALGGGVLNNGESYKDLDLYFLPLNVDEKPLPEPLLAFLVKQWGTGTVIGLPEYFDNGTYAHKVGFYYEGQRIDAFIV